MVLTQEMENSTFVTLSTELGHCKAVKGERKLKFKYVYLHKTGSGMWVPTYGAQSTEPAIARDKTVLKLFNINIKYKILANY